MKSLLKKNSNKSFLDKAIVSAMLLESIIIAISIREDMYYWVSLGALIIVGLKMTRKILDD